MSDPLSITASIAGLIAITAQIAGKAGELWNFGKDVKDAPESVRQIQEEMDEMKLDEVSGLRGAGGQKNKTGLIKERIQWTLWTEAAAAETLRDLQRHKLSLSLMLSIIQL